MTVDTQTIQALRQKTGAGMMDCKRALVDAAGDMDKAVEALRKKGLADAAKRAERTTKEGLIAGFVTPDGKNGGIIELNCETDFVAKTDEFQKLAQDLAEKAAKGEVSCAKCAEPLVKDLVGKLGENMGMRRAKRFELSSPGRLALYVHSAGGKKGAMVELKCASDDVAGHDAVADLGKELAMQAVAMQAKWLKKEDVPEDKVAKEREIYEEQVRKEGKPEQAVPKIVEGKLRKLFFQAYCLADQMSMRDNKTPIRKLVEDASKTAGGSVEIAGFARYVLGEE